LPGAIADIDYAVIGEGHAVHPVHVSDSPLAQEISVRIEYQDAAVAAAALAVGDVDVTVLPIDLNARGGGEAGGVRVEWRTLDGAIGGVEHALAADLLKELAAVMAVFLDHAAWRACDPDIVVRVEMAGVQPELDRTIAHRRVFAFAPASSRCRDYHNALNEGTAWGMGGTWQRDCLHEATALMILLSLIDCYPV
jgi:hypothetical protein